MISKLSGLGFAETNKQMSASHRERKNLENAQLNFHSCHNINEQWSLSYLAYVQPSSELIQNKSNTQI
jgi:hypothetical protein